MQELGLIRNLTFDQYLEDTGINSGMITMFCKGKTPAHIKAKYIDKKVPFDSEDLDFGRKAHTMILEPKRFKERHVIMPKFMGLTKDGKMSERSDAAKEKKEKWLAELPKDVIVVTEDEAEELTGMANKLNEEGLYQNILSEGVSELSGFWIDKESGARCKMRADFVNFVRKGLVDYKTARDARHDEFRDSCERLWYHVQLFHYLQGCKALELPIEDIMIIAQEKVYPWLPNAFFLNDFYLEDAKLRWRSALNQLAACQKSGVWPGFAAKINELIPSTRLMYKEVL